MTLGRCLVGLVALLCASAPLEAQTVPFGKNKVQYNDFDWHVLNGPNVDVYYYPEEDEVARLALAWAEESFTFLERKFQHRPQRRIPLIVYASDQHFEQTNVYPGFIPEGVLGFTEYLKRRVALPFRGDYDQFRRTLRHELVHAFQLSKLGEAARRIPRSHGESPQLIHWWTEGLAEFWSGEQTPEDDMYVRDLVVNHYVPAIAEFGRTYSFFSYPLGAELHRYLAGRFGDEYIVRVYEEYRLHDSFEETLEDALGIELEQLSREWRYALEQRFFPTFTQRPPLDVGARPVITEGVSYKPAVWQAPDDSVTWLLFLSPRTGYTNLYRARVDGRDRDIEPVLEGERSAEFESFHAFESGIDINADGIIALSSKFMERDALVLWNLGSRRVEGRHQWDDLVGIRSPRWAPDGRAVVFEGLSTAGFSDLYLFDFNSRTRRRLTDDPYRDLEPDWSPDGKTIVFASDRTPFGLHGRTNLIGLDVASGDVRYLTYGDWSDRAPRWSNDGTRIAFTSDRDGIHDLYWIDAQGNGRRLTEMTGGVFDPHWLPGDRALVFAGYHDRSFGIYQVHVPSDTARLTTVALDELPAAAPAKTMNGNGHPGNASWKWSDLEAEVLDTTHARPYEAWDRVSLDFAAADAVLAPGFGAAQGAQFLASDLLGDHIVFAGLSATQVQSVSNLLDSFSGNVLYLNLANRLNYGVGLFRFKGRFRDVAFDLYEESTLGGYLLASYPFSKFHRVELHVSAEHSNRRDTEDSFEGGIFGETTRPDPRDLTRKGWLTSTYISYVRDNTLWLATGPIDGERLNLTAGLVSCFACTVPSPSTGLPVTRAAAGENYVLSADYRRYIRTSLASAYALRVYAFFSDGAIPARTYLGGSLRLRGYPHFSLAGSRVGLLNQEWRFPLLRSLTLAFPFGDVRLPGIQGAVFTDIGTSWLENRERPEGAWGSYGLGLRMPLFAPIILRLDAGRRFNVGARPPVIFGGGGSFTGTFVDLFVGFNY